jgi:hypothetical protein
MVYWHLLSLFSSPTISADLLVLCHDLSQLIILSSPRLIWASCPLPWPRLLLVLSYGSPELYVLSYDYRLVFSYGSPEFILPYHNSFELLVLSHDSPKLHVLSMTHLSFFLLHDWPELRDLTWLLVLSHDFFSSRITHLSFLSSRMTSFLLELLTWASCPLAWLLFLSNYSPELLVLSHDFFSSRITHLSFLSSRMTSFPLQLLTWASCPLAWLLFLSNYSPELLVLSHNKLELLVFSLDSPELLFLSHDSPELFVLSSDSPELLVLSLDSPELLFLSHDSPELLVLSLDSPELLFLSHGLFALPHNGIYTSVCFMPPDKR